MPELMPEKGKWVRYGSVTPGVGKATLLKILRRLCNCYIKPRSGDPLGEKRGAL
jgi:hypothetical protein